VPPSAQYTKSFKRLRTNLKRGHTLLDRFFDNPGGNPRRAGQPAAHEQELLRSVLVLAIGALDAYLSEILIELIPRLAKAGTARAIFDRLMKENAGLILQAVYLSGSELEKAVAEAVESHFQGSVMHGSRAVNQIVNWCGLNLSFDDFNTAEFPFAMKALDEWTDKRHRIVHRGELVKLKRDDASVVLDLIEHIGKTLNDRALRVKA